MCVAPTRGQAEDSVQQVALELEPLPAVSMRLPPAGRAHRWCTRTGATIIFMTTDDRRRHRRGRARAPMAVTREYRMNRQCMAPLEGKGVLAYWDDHDDQLVVVTSTQSPHMIRAGLAEFLGLEQRRIRVIAPDVGGGFGYKVVLQPEELCMAWLALTARAIRCAGPRIGASI